MRSLRGPPRGFSLIELLVVIGVIAILLAIAMPIISSVRGTSRATLCAHNLRQIGIGLIGYASMNNSSFPVNSGTSGQFWYLKDVLGPHMNAPEVVGRSGAIPAGAAESFGLSGGVFVCPDDLEDSVRSYSMNLYASGGVSPAVERALASATNSGTLFKYGQGRESSKTLLAAESWSELPVTGTQPLVHAAQAIIGFKNKPGERFGGNGGLSWTRPPDATPNRFRVRKSQIDFSRHRPSSSRSRSREDPIGKANFLFVDGHVSTLSDDDVLNKKKSRSSYEVLWCPEDKTIESRMMGDPQ